MANFCVDTRGRIKWRGLLGFQCEVWMCAFVSLSIAAVCVAEEGTITIDPRNDVNVLYGQDLEINCTAGGNLTAEDLVFTIAGVEQPSEIINKTSIRLFMKKPEERLFIPIYCKSRDNKAIEVRVANVCSPPKEVVDFKCMSKNLEMLNCSWTSPDLIDTNYSLTFFINGNALKSCMARKTFEKSSRQYCYWNNTSQPSYRQQVALYNFMLTSHNQFGRKTQNFTIDHYSVIKPEAPLKLQIISVTSHSVLLQWEIPFNIVHFLPSDGIEHKIEYQIAKIDNTSVFRPVNTVALPPLNKSYRFNLTDLPYAHMQYGVRVYIKPTRAKSEEFWSDFSNLVFYTASERPQRPPTTIAGAYAQNKFQDHRLMYIYWQQLNESEEAGANFTYKVLVTYGSRTYTKMPDKSKSMSYLYLENAPLGAIEVTIYSMNEKGSSINSSQLYIPPENETKSLLLTSFSKLAYENGTYELSWVGINNIDNYTLFWCQHNATNICTGRVNFAVLDPKKNKHIINLPRDYRYQFAISVNKGTRTSGMLWAKCDISKDGIAMFGFPIQFIDHDSLGKTYVKLKWSMDCTLKDGIINGYNITYCPVIGTTNDCDKTEGKSTSVIIDNPKQMDVNITGLHPYRTYRFDMALLTIYGLKVIENATVHITTLEDTPTNPRNVKVTDVKSDSLVLSWDPPLYVNGRIKYVIYSSGNKIRDVDNYLSNKSRRQVTLEGLNGFTNYSLYVTACNEGIPACSNSSNIVFVRTRIGYPSKLSSPLYKNNRLSWDEPEISGGTVDRYQIKIVRDDKSEILNTTDLWYYITSCEGAIKNETYQVRAVNFDVDVNHGALAGTESVTLPVRDPKDTEILEFAGEWSKESTVVCRSNDNLFFLFIIMGILAVIGIGCGVLKAYKKIRKMGDIKPEFPKGLFVPEKDITKYPFGPLYPSDKEEKPMSDEMLLLPNTKTIAPPPGIKQTDNDNCGSSDHTDSTALSDASQCPMDRQNSTSSDDDSHSSLRLEVEPVKTDNENASQEDSNSESSHESSPYFSDNAFKKNKTTGYVQPVVSPVTGYVQSTQVPFKAPPPKPAVQPASSSYVMAGLSPPIFTTGVSASGGASRPPPPSGYVRPEDAQVRSIMMFPKLGHSPAKGFGTESLPAMPALPPPKLGEDSSHIQLQSLDAFPSHKPTVRNVPLKPASSGYVSPGDVVINKHMNNIMSGAQPVEESAILDPAMSPDAYCRFSWSTDPANDNLHSLLANSPAINSKNSVNH